jgi:hypothetical protein
MDEDEDDDDTEVCGSKPSHSKATRTMCEVSSERGALPGLVYVAPPDASDSEEETASVGSRDSAVDDTEPYVFRDLDDLSSYIAGASLMGAVSCVKGIPLSEVNTNDPEISKLNANSRLDHLCMDDLHGAEFLIKNLDDGAGNGEKRKSDGEDSVLDSDDDEEDDRDRMLKPRRQKTYSLSNKKGIEHFKKFLQGGPGEKNWWLWVDIEKATLIDDGEFLAQCVLYNITTGCAIPLM